MGIGSYIADVVLDVVLAVQLHQDGDMIYFALTVIFLFLSPISMTLWDAFVEEHKRTVLFNGIMNFLMLRMLYLTGVIWIKMPDRLSTKELSWFRLIDCILKTLPQLCLQLYILYEQDVSELSITRVLSIISGVISIAGTWYTSADQIQGY